MVTEGGPSQGSLMQVASVGEYEAVVDTSAHTVNLCTMAREMSCHSPSLAQERLCYSYGSASLGSFDMLCLYHECSYMQGYTHFPQFLPGSWSCIEAHKNSRLAERKTKQVFTINHIVCNRA